MWSAWYRSDAVPKLRSGLSGKRVVGQPPEHAPEVPKVALRNRRAELLNPGGADIGKVSLRFSADLHLSHAAGEDPR